MLFFSKPNNRNCGEMLTITSVHSCNDRKSENNSASKHRKVHDPNSVKLLTIVGRLLALLLALAVTVPVLLAEDGDHINGRDKAHDPTGVRLLNTSLVPHCKSVDSWTTQV